MQDIDGRGVRRSESADCAVRFAQAALQYVDQAGTFGTMHAHGMPFVDVDHRAVTARDRNQRRDRCDVAIHGIERLERYNFRRIGLLMC